MSNHFKPSTEAPGSTDPGQAVQPGVGATSDRTPTFREGRAGLDVEIFVDGNSMGSTTANGDGDSPHPGLAAGRRVSMRRSGPATDAAGTTSPPSNTKVSGFRHRDPARTGDSSSTAGRSTTTDPTPTITGTAKPGSQAPTHRRLESRVGSTTADEDGGPPSPFRTRCRRVSMSQGHRRRRGREPLRCVGSGVLWGPPPAQVSGQSLCSDRRPPRLASRSRCFSSSPAGIIHRHPRRYSTASPAAATSEP